MKALRSLDAPRVRRRAGFSLVELLVVIAIIGVLTALAVSFTLSSVENRRKDNTSTNLITLSKLMNDHWSKVIQDSQTEHYPSAVFSFVGNSPDRAKVVWTKFRLMEAFPISYYEIQNLYSASMLGNYIPQNMRKYNATYRGNIGSLSNSPPHLSESSACLRLALSVNRGGIRTLTDQDATQLDLDGDGIKELLDAWSQPLQFFRFPTGNANLNAAAPPNAKYKDPVDPQGLLQLSWAGQATFASLCHPVSGNPYVIPVLMSGGRDNQYPPAGSGLGFNPPPDQTMTVINPTVDMDNIYSYTLRLGS